MKRRAKALGYSGASEYVENLVLQDDAEKRTHAVVRDEEGARYEAVPKGFDPPRESKIDPEAFRETIRVNPPQKEPVPSKKQGKA